MRGLVALVFAIGFFATLLAQVASHSSGRAASQPPRVEVPKSGEADQLAESKTRNAPQFSSADGSVALDRAADGHFYAEVRINGNPIHMLVDTGATEIALSRDDARSAGLATSIAMPGVVGEGADGAVHGEFARLDRVELGPLSAEGLDAVVLSSGSQSLLGQSFLSKFASVQIEGDRMILR
ncbi:TIGR02281 family clan AA aspartic protease [Sphingomonas sp.]|uniref:retropepsin-like aspartic protease family protein n=1 Tax=Sphingomonas sp. TaxID=28214 RepID=UPI0038A33D90